MSDEPNAQQPGESDHEHMQRISSPPLQTLHLIRQLAERGAASEAETKQKFDFILDQQAQLVASVGQLAATVDKLSNTVDKLSGTVDKLSNTVDRTAGSITNLLAVAEIQAGEINDLTQAVRAVDERQRHTDERLNVLINTVERFISEGRNGKS